MTRCQHKVGIVRAKTDGAYKGCSKTIDENRIWERKCEGHGVTKIAGLVGVSRMTVY